MPQNQVFILHRIIPCSPLLHALGLFALVCEFACGEELVILILGHPDWPGSELCPLQPEGLWVSQEHLARRGLQFVCDRVVRDWVDDTVIPNLKHAMFLNTRRCTAAVLDHVLFSGISHEVRIRVVLRHRNTIFIVDSVLIPIQSGINSEREHVLMEWRHHTRSNIRTPGHGLTILIIEWHGGQDTSCADFKLDVGCLVEDKGKDVFVVSHGANHLHHELSVPNHRCCTGAVVGVLVLETVVLLMHANDILELDRLALGVCSEAVKVLDVTQAVTPEGKLVGCDAEADVAYVKGLLAVVRGAWI